MTDPVIQEKLALLSTRIQSILQEKAALKDEIRYYQAENKELRHALEQLKNLPKNTVSQIDTAHNQESTHYAEKVAAIAKQIDVYVEEIDRCIAQLGE